MTDMQPKYCTFEQAKLLKEKGYEIDTEEVLFCKDEINNIKEHQIKNRNFIYAGGIIYKIEENEYRIYEQWQVVEWLNSECFIDISVSISTSGYYMYEIWKLQNKAEQGWIRYKSYYGFKSRQEAYSAAFDYVLNNLI
jgi:hypothetical protein